MKRIISLICAVVLIFSIVPPISAQAAETAAIQSVEVTQVMGKGVDETSGKLYYMNMFVAEKTTAIQVVLDTAVSVDAKTQSLTVYRDGTQIAVLSPTAKSGKRQILEFNPTLAELGGLTEGRYKFVAKVGDSEKTTEAMFNASRTLKILIVRASVLYDGKKYDAPDKATGIDWLSVLKRTYPIKDGGIKVVTPPNAIDFGLGKDGYDVSTPEGQSKFLGALENLSRKRTDCDFVVGYVSSELGLKVDQYGIKTASDSHGYGITQSQHSLAVSAVGDEAVVLAHELGHCYALGDEYWMGMLNLSINGAPNGTKGYDYTGTQPGKMITANRTFQVGLDDPQNNLPDGTTLGDAQNGYDPISRSAIYDSACVMGNPNRGEAWTTSYAWEQLYSRLVPNHKNVLPRVYADGTVAVSRPTENEITDAQREKVINEILNATNSLRALDGAEKLERLQIAEDLLQTALEEAVIKGEKTIDANPIRSQCFAQGVPIYKYQSGTTVYTYNGVQYITDLKSDAAKGSCSRATFTNKADHYMIIAVFRRGSQYYTASLIWGPQEQEAKSSVAAFTISSEAPKLETNPVTNEAYGSDNNASQEAQDDLESQPEQDASLEIDSQLQGDELSPAAYSFENEPEQIWNELRLYNEEHFDDSEVFSTADGIYDRSLDSLCDQLFSMMSADGVTFSYDFDETRPNEFLSWWPISPEYYGPEGADIYENYGWYITWAPLDTGRDDPKNQAYMNRSSDFQVLYTSPSDLSETIFYSNATGTFRYGRGVYYYDDPDAGSCYLLVMCIVPQ